MKLSTTQLEEILNDKPVLVDEFDIKEVFALLGFKLKEYSKASLSPFQHYEVHLQRNYLYKVEVDDSRCLSLSNEYIDFGDGLHGISFGGVDTVTTMLKTILSMVHRLNCGYDGQVTFNEEESEYTPEEIQALYEVFNEKIFS